MCAIYAPKASGCSSMRTTSLGSALLEIVVRAHSNDLYRLLFRINLTLGAMSIRDTQVH